MKQTLMLSEEALRLGMAIAALFLAAYLAHPKPAVNGVLLAAGPKPGQVMEW